MQLTKEYDSIAVVICTYQRHEILTILLQHIKKIYVNNIILVVDSSLDENTVNAIEDLKKENSNIIYLKSQIQSLPHQRNLGYRYLIKFYPDKKYVQFLDDDTFPTEDYSRILLDDLLRLGTNTAGICGRTNLDRASLRGVPKIIGKISVLYSEKLGTILPSGLNVSLPLQSNAPIPVDWLFGCSLWRIDCLDSSCFTNQSLGYSLGEDVKLSVNVGKKGYKLYCQPKALLYSIQVNLNKIDTQEYISQRLQMRTELFKLFFDNPKTRTKILFYWSIASELLLSLLSGLFVYLRKENLLTKNFSIKGYVKGFKKLLTNV